MIAHFSGIIDSHQFGQRIRSHFERKVHGFEKENTNESCRQKIVQSNNIRTQQNFMFSFAKVCPKKTNEYQNIYKKKKKNHRK